jgi:NAD(P)-dependent dehydrogenase (short-subunit alcohol dehydrogenase family)
LFAARGALVYAADLNEAGLEETRGLVLDAGGQLRTAVVNVAQESEIADLLARIERDAGRLDSAFNNAGITGGTHRIEDYPAEDFDRVIGVNLRSVFLGMKYELPLLLRQGGTVVNTASVAALTGPGGMSAYAASKHGVHGLTRVAAMENAARGVRINAIAPGWTETPMVAANSAQNPAFAALARQAIPAKRGAHPAEIAEAAVWLSSPASSYMHGQLLVVDGGMTIGGFEL